MRISVALALTGFLTTALAATVAESPEPGQQPDSPPPLKPPHKPVQHDTQLALILGFNFFSYGQYGYKTTVTMPNGSTFNYAGKQAATGGTVLFGLALRPPSALRRLTLGFTLDAGGLNAWSHPVIPNGVQPPFSQENLDAQIRRSAALTYGWRPVFSPYIEHDLAFLWASRIRAGYQYWHQSGSYRGSFPPDQSRSSPWADYNVQFSHTSHLIRLSINNQISFEDDSDPNSPPPKRNLGFLRQAGLLIGTNRTVMITVGFGPAWNF